MIEVVKRYHCDIDFTHPDGMLDMAQTLSYCDRDKAVAEAEGIKIQMQRVGCTDIKIYVREIRVRKEDWQC